MNCDVAIFFLHNSHWELNISFTNGFVVHTGFSLNIYVAPLRRIPF